MEYKKSFIPLESDPEIFTELMHDLGASSNLQFIDVWSLEDDDIGFTPRPVLALILILPPCPIYEKQRDTRNLTTHDESGEVVWMKQKVNNACGLYSIIHSVCNIPGIIGKRIHILLLCYTDRHTYIEPSSVLDRFAKSHNRTKFLEDDEELERCYMKSALKGHSEAPSAETEVDHHYISLIKHSGRLYILDGDMDGPMIKGELEENKDVLGRLAIDVIREYTKSDTDGTFSLLALVESETIQ